MNGEADRGATPTIFSLRLREEVPGTGMMMRDKCVMMRDKCVIPFISFFPAGEDTMLRQE